MNMRKSSRVIIYSKQDIESIYLIYRVKNGEIYYVIPGGGVEDGESFEEAAVRESIEETGVELSNLKQIYLENNKIALYSGNEVSKIEPTGPELKNTNPNNYYEVQLHKISDIGKLNLKPEFYKDIISKLKPEES